MLHASENFPVFYHITSFILSACGCCMGKGSYSNTKHKYVIRGFEADVWFSLRFLSVCFVFFYVTLSKNDHAVPTWWPDQTKPQNLVLFHMELCCGPYYLLEQWMGLPGFSMDHLWTKGTPKYIPRNRAALVNISREQGNKPNFGGSESGNLENPFLCIGHTHSLIVRRQSQCFDALLIFKRMLMSENWLKQDVRILQFMHRICGTFCVRRYQQFCTLMVNGNAYNQNSLIAVTQWVEKADLIRSAVWSYSIVHAEKVRLALATPLWKQLSHFIAETLRGPCGCFNCLS